MPLASCKVAEDSIVCFNLQVLFTALTVLVMLSAEVKAYLCAPESRTIASTNGKYLLVLLVAQDQREFRAQDSIAEQDRIEAKYKRSGLYRNDGSTELLWPIDYLSTAKEIQVCNDGIHLVVTFLNWNSRVSDHGNAVEFYERGTQLARYDESDLLACYQTRLLASKLTVTSWPEGTDAVLDEPSGMFTLRTNWGDAFQFDFRTGELVGSRVPSPLIVLASFIAIFILLMLLSLGWWLRSIRSQIHKDSS